MKLSRLWQPTKPAFWLMVILNALSAVLGWLVQTYALSPVASWLVALFAIGNGALGTYFAWQLVRGQGGLLDERGAKSRNARE